MRTLLHQLENNESVLMMYAAGELPPQDRAEVEQMLATDAGMRAELARLRETLDAFDAAMTELDATGRPLPGADVAARRVGRLVAQWHGDRLAARAAARPARETGLGSRWSYPLAAAAACVLISLSIWWASNSGRRSSLPPHLSVIDTQPNSTAQSDDDAALAERGLDPFLLPADGADDDEDSGVAAVGGGGGGVGGTETAATDGWTDRLDALERDLYTLSADAQSNTFFAEPAEFDTGTPDGF